MLARRIACASRSLVSSTVGICPYFTAALLMVSSMIRMPAVTVAAHRAYLEVGRRHIRPVSNHTHHGDFGHASCHEVRLQQCGLAKARGDGYVLEALLPFKNRAAAALAVAERMDASLASAVMGKLQYREGYADISKTAQATTISLLKSVCDPKPAVTAAPCSPSPR
ncbi:hypothetical protein EXN51_14990 [Agrobacterium fabrum]|uniref:Uncharacterized protein n=1 Tax=Agrobacterium fabrum (strain C58 / ATCC 33970) TaxID=176299 RepID=Q8U5U4_AGRFC|nr:hypothetical protein Atu5304 [Agrobacterium fabrum str. C58]KJX90412.1 hypothetical protein SY94_5300 [Agrobacterium tumefaciens]TRB27989.1 hypothetical protein EXN51_14990 [Agrobacterium fabrum]